MALWLWMKKPYQFKYLLEGTYLPADLRHSDVPLPCCKENSTYLHSLFNREEEVYILFLSLLKARWVEGIVKNVLKT